MLKQSRKISSSSTPSYNRFKQDHFLSSHFFFIAASPMADREDRRINLSGKIVFSSSYAYAYAYDITQQRTMNVDLKTASIRSSYGRVSR